MKNATGYERKQRHGSFRLIAAPPIAALVTSEPEVRDHIRRFARGEIKDDRLEVLLKGHDKDSKMPRASLTMIRAKNLATGQAGVEVVCSDADLAAIALRYTGGRAAPTAH